MTTQDNLSLAERLLQPWARASALPAPDRLDISLDASTLKAAVSVLEGTHWGHLVAITGLDHPGAATPPSNEQQWQHLGEEEEDRPAHLSQPEGSVEVLYHFSRGAALLTLRLSVRYSRPVLPSICDLVPAATLYERELIEMYGVRVEGTPDPARLLLPDDWPDGIYPMRKSFTGLKEA
jgi:NADH:ubiquinone oxidoreductase subunit C